MNLLHMNLLHIKYAVTVAETGSISRAAEKLLIGQPNLSRSIKELEAAIGVKLFKRSAKGMKLTPDGEVFLTHAKSILRQVDAVAEAFRKGASSKKRFSVSVPRASYIADVFVRFSKAMRAEPDVELIYKETNALRALKNLLEGNYCLAVIRYAENYDEAFQSMMEEKGLSHELIAEVGEALIMNREHPLAAMEQITSDDLAQFIEIAHADSMVPSLPLAEQKMEELPDNIRRRIFVFERASQFELLAGNPDTFMRVSAVPQASLAHYGLVELPCPGNARIFRDVLVYRKGYHFSELDQIFLTELRRAGREVSAPRG